MFCYYLWKNLNDEEVFNEKTLKKIKSDIDTLRKGDGQYPYLANDTYDRLMDRVIEWTFVHKRPNVREINPKQYR